MAVIYKATNRINEKSYIGFAVDFDTRKQNHFRRAIQGGEYFHNALTKYGIDNFEWSILLEDATLDDEIRLIEEHQTFWKHGKGYNLTKGGEGKLGYITSSATKQKISKSHETRVVTDKQLKVLRENAQKMKLMGHTEKTKIRISNSSKGKEFSLEHKKKIGESNKHKVAFKTKEYSEKMRKNNLGKVRTPEQKERYRLAAIKRWKSQEYREKNKTSKKS